MAWVYVSSTIADLEAERQAVIDWLVAAQHQVVHSYRPSSDAVRDGCLADVETSDLYVLIQGHRYGFQPPDDNPEGLSITEMEFRRAGQSGIPRVALLRTSVPNIRLSDMENPERAALVLAFRAEVARAVKAAEFGDLRGLVQELSTGVQGELDKLQAKRVELAKAQAERVKEPVAPVGAGRVVRLAPRPVSLVGREDLLAELESRLAGGDGRGPRVVALHGLAGAGKTSVAQTPWRARCVERRTAGSARGPGKRTGSNPSTAPRAYSARAERAACRPACDPAQAAHQAGEATDGALGGAGASARGDTHGDRSGSSALAPYGARRAAARALPRAPPVPGRPPSRPPSTQHAETTILPAPSLEPTKITVKSAAACGLRVLRMALRATLDCDLRRHMIAPIGRMARTGAGPECFHARPIESGQFLDNDLVAQRQALLANGHRSGDLAASFDRHRGKAGDLMAMLAAEAAPRPSVLLRHGVHRPELGGGGVTGADHAPGQLDTPLADVHARSRYQLAYLGLRPPAERARQVGARIAPTAPAARTASSLHNLMHPLVTEPECGSDITKRRAVKMQPPHGAVKLSAGNIGVMLGIDQPLLSLPGLAQQFLIHAVYGN